MASVNPLSRELVFKIVYYGPGLGGKTTTLEHLHATAKPEHRGKLVSLATPVDRTLYFDFLPVRLPAIRGMKVRLQLFTVPGQVYFVLADPAKLALTGAADGVVFVSDSQAARADSNLESFENLKENLAEQGRDLALLPIVFQHNKRDLPDLLPIEELDHMLNPFGAPSAADVRGERRGHLRVARAHRERRPRRVSRQAAGVARGRHRLELLGGRGRALARAPRRVSERATPAEGRRASPAQAARADARAHAAAGARAVRVSADRRRAGGCRAGCAATSGGAACVRRALA